MLIIKEWFYKASKEKEYINKFICLWISFNCFFVARFFNNAVKRNGNKEPSEANYLDLVKESYAEGFDEYIVKNHEKPFLEFKAAIAKKRWCPGKIIDMRPLHRDKLSGKSYKAVNSLDEYLSCVYQIRCNIFHGNKKPNDDNDLNLVKPAYKSLRTFLKYIYRFERIPMI